MEAAAVANLPRLRTEPELLRLEELNLLDADFSFGFFVFFLLEEAEFSLTASESAVIAEVLASIPKHSCPTCLESRALRLVVDGGERTEGGGAHSSLGWAWRG